MADPTPADPPSKTRGGVGVLVVVVLCCGLVFWAIKSLSYSSPIYRVTQRVRSGSIEERRDAILYLGNVATHEVEIAIDALVDALADENEDVRADAARSLGAIGLVATAAGPGGIREMRKGSLALLRALEDERPGVRLSAARALTSLTYFESPSDPEGSPFDHRVVVNALAKVLGDPDAIVRIQACKTISAVAGNGRPSSNSEGRRIPPPPRELVNAFRNDPLSEMRAEAAATIGHFQVGNTELLRELFAGVKSDDLALRAGCVTGLRSLRSNVDAVPYLIQTLKDDNADARSMAAAVLGNLHSEALLAVPALIAMTTEPPLSRSPGATGNEPSSWAASALSMITPGTAKSGEAIAALEAMLASDSGTKRTYAAWKLEYFAPVPDSTIHALIAAMKMPDADLDSNSHVIRSLTKLAQHSAEAEDAVSALIDALDSPKTNIQIVASQSPIEFGQRAAPALARLRVLESDSSDGPVRAAAQKAIALIEAARALP